MSKPVFQTLEGGADARAAEASLAARFRGHADTLDRGGRSPLCVALMRAAADDIEARGRLRELFDGVSVAPGSVPALRLLAALHHLVLAGRAPELAAFYPSAGGIRPPDGAWPVALQTLAEHADWVHERLQRAVQTNEPGRAAVLFPALLWLTSRYRLPIRLLEIGSSVGLILMADRFCYLVDGAQLGAPASTVRFADPWKPPPVLDLAEAARALCIVEREGCDPAPLDPRDSEDRLTALSYIWPDERERLERTRAALGLAADDPPPVVAIPAERWLPQALAAADDGQLTVIWQSVVRQYVEPESWAAIELAFREALGGRSEQRPVVWLSMEPSGEHGGGFRLTMRTACDEPQRLLARCGDHGPPVIWSSGLDGGT